ncbi:21347_t:CDS:1, partial [Gigaspora rosea]
MKILSTKANATLQSLSNNIHQTMSKELDDLDDELEALSNYLTYPMKAKKFLSIPEEDT